MNIKLIISKLISTLCFLLVCTFLVTGIYGCQIESRAFSPDNKIDIKGDVNNTDIKGDVNTTNIKGDVNVTNDSIK